VFNLAQHLGNNAQCGFRELKRENVWSRIYLTPMLLAEGDRDAYRREQAALAREREIMKDVTGWEVRCVVDSDIFRVSNYLRPGWKEPLSRGQTVRPKDRCAIEILLIRTSAPWTRKYLCTFLGCSTFRNMKYSINKCVDCFYGIRLSPCVRDSKRCQYVKPVPG